MDRENKRQYDVKSYAELTEYKKIFSQVYWGQFTAYVYKDGTMNTSEVPSDNNKTINDIVQNRNEFARKYKIKSSGLPYKTVTKFIYDNFTDSNKHYYKTDHVEYYKTYDDKLIVISSPYVPSAEDIEKYLKKGWIQIEQLYSNTATTFMISFII